MDVGRSTLLLPWRFGSRRGWFRLADRRSQLRLDRRTRLELFDCAARCERFAQPTRARATSGPRIACAIAELGRGLCFLLGGFARQGVQAQMGRRQAVVRNCDLDAVDDAFHFGIPQGIRLALKLFDLFLKLFVGLCHCLL